MVAAMSNQWIGLLLAGVMAGATLSAGNSAAFLHHRVGAMVDSPLPPAVLVYGDSVPPDGSPLLQSARAVYRIDAPQAPPADALPVFPEGVKNMVALNAGSRNGAAWTASPAMFRGLEVILAPGVNRIGADNLDSLLSQAVSIQGAAHGIWLRLLPLPLAALAAGLCTWIATQLAARHAHRRQIVASAVWTLGGVGLFLLARSRGMDLPWGVIIGPSLAPLWMAVGERQVLNRAAARVVADPSRPTSELLATAIQTLLPEHIVLVVEQTGSSSIQIPATLSAEGRMPLPQAMELVAASPCKESFLVQQRGLLVATLTLCGRPLRAEEMSAVYSLLHIIDVPTGPHRSGIPGLRSEWGAFQKSLFQLRDQLRRLHHPAEPRPPGGGPPPVPAPGASAGIG